MKLGNMEGGGGIDSSPATGKTARMTRFYAVFGLVLLGLAAPALAETESVVPAVTVPARGGEIPRTRWEHVAGSALWTRSALSALGQHGRALEQTVPRDIADWCPSYPDSGTKGRRAFWVGFLSALAEYESTFRPTAVGGGGRWFGLMQILPSTARGYGCRAGSGDALKHGPDNLSCAIRIMARTVSRDGVVSQGMRGVAADWGPLHSESKRSAMMRWTRAQTYCRPMSDVRPRQRPAGAGPVATIATRD